VALVDENKTIRWKAQWYPFGELYDEFVSSTNEIRFPGQWEDDETGLYYNWHRYYGPATGRYYQADPIGLDGGDYNLYRYGYGNPLSNSDPDGRMPVLLVLWGAYEIGSAIYDIWTAGKTLSDDCASWEEKATAFGGLMAGIILPGGGYGSAGKALVRVQKHHAISKKIFNRLEESPLLKGKFQFRDPRFMTQAKDLPAHYGYQKWHRELDAEISGWIKNRPKTTQQDFINYLLKRYNNPDLRGRFPEGIKIQ
jgi:RHS repeat-associated protein